MLELSRGVVCGALALAATVPAFAETPQKIAFEAQGGTSGGKELQIGVYATVSEPCKGAPVPQIRISQAPAGGKLIIRLLPVQIPATDAVCAGKAMLSQQVYYQSDAGFSGQDLVKLDIGVPGQPIQSQEISINVKE